MQIIKMPYDLLRDERITSRDQLVIGKRYMECHVPLDNPYTGGVHPHWSVATLIAVGDYSANETLFRGLEPTDRPWANEKKGMFCLRRKSLIRRDMDYWDDWGYLSDHGIDTDWLPYNFLLDGEALRARGIQVMPYTSVPYVISDELREEREWERKMSLDVF